MSKYIIWEPPTDFLKFDQLSNVTCGSDSDITIGMSEVTDPVSIKGWDYNNKVMFTVTEYVSLDTSTDYCKITGNLTSEWGTPRDYERIQLYSDNLEDTKAIWTNTQGDYMFLGRPGQRFKVKFSKNWDYYWFMVPDKGSITFTELISNYGYTIDG